MKYKSVCVLKGFAPGTSFYRLKACISVALIIIFLFVWFYMLGARPLVLVDEGRYAEMAREMFVTHDWVTTRLNGIKFFDKPPLQAWMNAMTFALFGLGEWQARLWTGLCGLFGIAVAAYTAYRLFNRRTGFYAGIVLASSVYWAAMSHINTLDMSLAAMTTLSLCSFLLAQSAQVDKERRNWMLLCWAGMALAVLSKGLVGIVWPGAVLFLYALLKRDWTIWQRIHLLPGLSLFFAIAAPWFILVSLKNPEFPRFFFIHEHFQRFTSTIHGRNGPWYYFFPILALGIVPWLGVLLQSLWHGARHHGNNGSHPFQPCLVLIIWAVFIFCFFSISHSQLPSYILPIMPALALLIARYLSTAPTTAIVWAAIWVVIPGVIICCFVPYIIRQFSDAYIKPFVAQQAPWIYAALLTACMGALLSIFLVRRYHKDWAMIILGMTAFLSGQLLMFGHAFYGRYSAGINSVPSLQAELMPHTPLYSIGRYEQALPFYLGHTMILVQHAPYEMQFGLQQEPHLWLPTIDLFMTRWVSDATAGKKGIALMNPEIYVLLQQRGLPMRLLSQDPRRVIVTNNPSNKANQ